MNNYCIYLKKRKGQPFCKLLNKEITFAECSAVNSAEHCRKYKTKNAKNSFYTKPAKKQQELKKRSKKLAKVERSRYSVFTNDLEHCYLCGRNKEEIHEIFAGRNRLNSMKYGLTLPLCHKCHSESQNDTDFNDFWHRDAQLYFEKNIGSRNDFMAIFRKNYLD